MVTERTTDRPENRFPGSEERWQRTWSHREQLLKVARRRSLNPEDAEDAVHEAMVRAVETPGIDDQRLGAWLTTVTMRLCVDRYRQVDREIRDHPRLIPPGPVPVEEAVCDRDEARWLAGRSGKLPARQAEALRLKSQDLDVGQVAGRMGLSYEAVESLLARARRTLRSSLAGTLSAAALSALWARLRDGVSAPVAVTTASATLAVLGAVVVPQVSQPYGTPPALSAERVERGPGTGGDPAPEHGAPDAGADRPTTVRPYGDPAGPSGLIDGLPHPLPDVPDAATAEVTPPVPLPDTRLPEPAEETLDGRTGPDAATHTAPDAARPSLRDSSDEVAPAPDATDTAPDAPAPEDGRDAPEAPEAPDAVPELP